MGVMNFSKSWSTNAVELAMQFNPPELIHGAGAFGWDPRVARFVLPKFQVEIGGKVIEEASPVLGDLSPGITLEPPSVLAPRLAGLTEDTSISQIFWATVASVAANVIAPAINEPVAGIGLVGMGAAVIGRLAARSAGCQEYPLKLGSSVVDIADRLRFVTSQHSWPLVLVIPQGAHRNRLATWLNSTEDKNVIMDVNTTTATALAVQSNWRFIISNEPLTSANAAVLDGPAVLPNWLQDICERKLELRSNRSALVHQILDDMAIWAGKRDGDADVIRSAVEVLDDLEHDGMAQAERFAGLLYGFVESGDLIVGREGYNTSKAPTLWHLPEHEPPAIFAARNVIQRLLTGHKIPLPDPAHTTQILTEAGCLIAAAYNGVSGWLIEEEWWNHQLARCRARQHRLRIV